MQRLKDRGPWPLTRVVLAGGGEPADAGSSGQRPLQGVFNTQLSPSSNWGGSLSSSNPDRVGGLCLLSSGLRTLPPTHPPLRPLPNRGGREEVDTKPLDRPWGSRIRSLGPGTPAPRLRPLLRLRGYRSLRKLRRIQPPALNAAPRPACSRSRMRASYAASGRQGLQEAARGRGAGAAVDPAGARIGRSRGQRPFLVCGAARGPTGLCLFAGPPIPTRFFPIPKPRSRRQAEGRNDFPSPGL